MQHGEEVSMREVIAVYPTLDHFHEHYSNQGIILGVFAHWKKVLFLTVWSPNPQRTEGAFKERASQITRSTTKVSLLDWRALI